MESNIKKNNAKYRIKFILLITSMLFLQPQLSAQKLYFKDFIQENEKDATLPMLEMMQEAKKLTKPEIIIEKGIYHFYPQKAFETYCFITNHDDGLRSTPFPIIGFKNLSIKADNAQFIFHGLMVPIIIRDSENIHLSGFSIDWKIPLHTEMKVVDIDEDAHTFDIEVNSPYEIRNNELLFLKEGFEHNLERAICWDPKTMAVAFNTVQVTPLTVTGKASIKRFEDRLQSIYPIDPQLPPQRFQGKQLSLTAKELQPGVIRIFGHDKKLPKPGWIIVAKGENSLNRLAPAIHVKRCSDIVVADVTVHHAGGMGIVCERTENVTLDQFNVALKEGSGRMLTTTADATHFNNCRGHVELKNCLLENMLDDGTNVHGTYARVVDILGKNKIGIRLGHFQQFGFEIASSGDKCGFIKEDVRFTPFIVSKVKKIIKLNKRYYSIEFEEELKNVAVGDLLENLDWYPSLTISGCTIKNNRARGILLSTPREIIVENNYFSNMMSSVLFPSGFANVWYESGKVKNCIIRNNIFKDSGYGGKNRAVIATHVDESEENYPVGKIVIDNNTFANFDPYVFDLERIDSLIIKNNTIEKSGNYPELNLDKKVLNDHKINHLILKDNTITNEWEFN